MYTTQQLGYYSQHAMQGLGRLGDATSDYCAANPAACGGSSGSSSGSTKKTGTDWISDILGWGKTASDIYQNTQGSGGGGSTTVINTPAPATGMGLGTKVAIGAAGMVIVGGLAYALWPKKKKS